MKNFLNKILNYFYKGQKRYKRKIHLLNILCQENWLCLFKRMKLAWQEGSVGKGPVYSSLMTRVQFLEFSCESSRRRKRLHKILLIPHMGHSTNSVDSPLMTPAYMLGHTNLHTGAYIPHCSPTKTNMSKSFYLQNMKHKRTV